MWPCLSQRSKISNTLFIEFGCFLTVSKAQIQMILAKCNSQMQKIINKYLDKIRIESMMYRSERNPSNRLMQIHQFTINIINSKRVPIFLFCCITFDISFHQNTPNFSSQFGDTISNFFFVQNEHKIIRCSFVIVFYRNVQHTHNNWYLFVDRTSKVNLFVMFGGVSRFPA